MYRRLIATCLIFSSCAITATYAAPMYKVVDEHGNVTYTDQPPSDPNAKTSTPVESKPMNVLEGSADKNYQKAFERHTEERQKARDTAWKTYDDAVRQAEQNLAAARKALQQNSGAGEGDYVGVYAKGRQSGVRPSDAYLERQEALKRAVADAEAELSAAKRSKPKLSR